MFKKISINTLLSSAGRVVGIIVSFITVRLIAENLGVEGFGNYSTIFAYLLAIQAFADFGLNTLLTRELSQHHKNQHNRIFSEFFTTRLILVVLTLIIGCLAIFLFPYEENIKIGVLIGSFTIVSMSLSQIFLGVFQYNLTVYKFAIAELLGRALHLILIIILVAVDANFYWYVFVFGLALLAVFFSSFLFIRREISIRIKINTPRIKNILKNSFPIAVSIILTILYFRSDTIMLSIMDGAKATGYYNAAYKVLESFIFFPAMLIGIFLPIMSRKAKEGVSELSGILSFLLNVLVLFSIPTVVGGILLSSSIISIIGGSEFLPATRALQILFIAIGIISISTVFSNAVIVLNIQRKAVFIYGIGFVFNIIANLILIPMYSYNGAAYATLLTEFMILASLMYIIYKNARFKPSMRITLSSVFASSIMGYAIFKNIGSLEEPVSIVSTILLTIVGSVIYVSLLSFLAPYIHQQYNKIKI